jgi:hypothetical protein
MPRNRYEDFDLAIESGWDGWRINGKRARPSVVRFLTDTNSLESVGRHSCPFCRIPLKKEAFIDLPSSDTDQYLLYRQYHVSACTRCAYWEFKGSESSNRCMDPPVIALAQAVATQFSISAPPECASEFAQFLRRCPSGWHTVSPTRLERLVADIFKANYQHCEVLHVGGPGDRGIDVLLVDSSQTQWLIQVKRRSDPQRKEGFDTLQAILGTLALKGDRHGIVVSTADAFSQQARAKARNAKLHGFIVELVDRHRLDTMLSPLLPVSPWLSVLEKEIFDALDVSVRNYFLQRFQVDQVDLFG